jgi:hypothetical protein
LPSPVLPTPCKSVFPANRENNQFSRFLAAQPSLISRQIQKLALIFPRWEGTGAVFEAKFMLPWSFSEEAAAEKYMLQLQHNMWVVAARTAVLGLNSTDDAANWAHLVLGAKNTLTAADAARVEHAFEDRLAYIATGAADGPQISHKAAHRPTHRGKRRRPTAVIDKTVLALSAPRRVRDREHVKSVAKQPCLVCGRRPADAHHLRSAQSRALGRKVSDEFTVPLCRGHHREVHHCGDECAWWDKAGIDPTVIARALWLETHPLPANADKIEPEGTYSVFPVGSDQISGKHDRPVRKRGQNYKTIEKAAPSQ